MTEVGVEAEFALEEPCLKYHRIANDCSAIYAETTITAMAAHDKFIVFGCKNGAIYILDHMGNRIENGYYKKHFYPVNDLSISEKGDYILSCADDGFAIVYNLTEPAETEVVNVNRVLKTISVGPSYSRRFKFVTGEKSVVIHSKGVLKRRTSEVLYVSSDYVRALEWRENFVAWVDDLAVRVYDAKRRTLVNYIQRPTLNQEFLEGRLPCCLSWHSDTCFLFGCGNVVLVCHVVGPPPKANTFEAKWSTFDADRDSASSIVTGTSPTSSIITTAGQPSRTSVRISNQMDVGEAIICGLASHQNRVLVLIYLSRSIELLLTSVDGAAPPLPQIVMIDVGESLSMETVIQQLSEEQISIVSLEEAEEINREEIMLSISSETMFHGLGLATISGKDTHFLFSPIDAIYAQTPSADDRIEWFLEQNLPQRALQIANENSSDLVKYSPKTLGMTYMDNLIKEKNFVGAAALSVSILTDTKAWEDQVYSFLQLNQITTLVPYLPVSKGLLNAVVMGVILQDLMKKSPQMFLQKLKDWGPSSGLFEIDPIIASLVDATCSYSNPAEMFAMANENPDVLILLRALIFLYEHAGYPEKGLELSINLKDKDVFELLRRQLPGAQGGNFGSVARKHIIALFEIDDQKAILLMIDCMRELPVDFVVKELDAHPLYLYKYLDALYLRNPHAATPHIPRMVSLYATYARNKLLPFLRTTDRYPLNDALELCQGLSFIPETVYLLTRVGRRKEALRLLMEKGEKDALLMQNTSLTEEQRRAEVAAQAIAYCLESDSASTVQSAYYDYYSQTDNKLQPHRHKRRKNQGTFFAIHADDAVEGSDCSERSRDEHEEAEREDAHIEAESASRDAGELWKQVVLFAVDKPTFICALLNQASTECIDPGLLLRKISPNTQIPKLKDSLVNLLHNTQMQVEVRRSCQRILLSDSHDIFTRLVNVQGRGIFVNPYFSDSSSAGASCRLCRQPLFLPISGTDPSLQKSLATTAPSEDTQPPLAVFRCSHSFHKACILKFGKFVACPVCFQDH